MKWKPMPKASTKSKKAAAAKTKSAAVKKTSRKLAQPKYKSFRVSKRIKQPKPPLTGSFRLFARSLSILKKNWRLCGGITLIYMVLTLLLVKGFVVSGSLANLHSTIESLTGNLGRELSGGVGLFSSLVNSATSTSDSLTAAYQSILLVIFSLVYIWVFRQRMASQPPKVTIRDGFYKSLYPLIPFLLVLIVIGLQTIPLLFASFLYNVVIGGGIAVTIIENALWILLFLLLVILSVYMICSSIFALYIVTLPDMTPMVALRSARDLVRFRRWMIIRKVLFLPAAMIVIAAAITIPLIFLSAPVAEWVFFILSMLGLMVVHAYMYSLYRELL